MVNYEKIDTGTLLAFALCLDDPAAIDSQQKLLQHLIHTILFNNEGAQLNINTIQTKLADTFGATDIFPLHKIEGAIKNSIQEGTIEELSNKEYKLSENRVNLIETAQEKHNLSRDSFHQNIVQNIEQELKEKLSKEISDKIFEEVDILLLKYFLKRAYHILDACKGTDKWFDCQFEKTQTEEWSEIISRLLVQKHEIIIPPTKREKIIKGIVNSFKKIPVDAFGYINSLHRIIFYSQYLNLDPSLQKLIKKLFKDRRIYLDTNVLLAAIFESHSFHLVVRNAISFSKSIGVSLLISPFTLNEFTNQLNAAKWRFKQLGSDPYITELIKHGNDIFLKAYYAAKTKQNSLNWEHFINVYENAEEYIFEKLEVLVENEMIEDIDKEVNYEKIKNTVTEVKTNKRLERGLDPGIAQKTIEHDTKNFLLIHRLRNKYKRDEMGATVWFLTLDHDLVLKTQRYLKHDYPEPACKLAEEWNNRLLFYMSLDMTKLGEEDYLRFLINSQLGLLAIDEKLIDIDLLISIKKSELPLNELMALSPEHTTRALLKLQKDREVRQLVQEAVKEQDSVAKTALNLKFQEKLEKAVRDEEELVKSKEQLESKIEELKSNFILKENELLSRIDNAASEKNESERLLTNELEQHKKVIRRQRFFSIVAFLFILIIILIVIFSKKLNFSN